MIFVPRNDVDDRATRLFTVVGNHEVFEILITNLDYTRTIYLCTVKVQYDELSYINGGAITEIQPTAGSSYSCCETLLMQQ